MSEFKDPARLTSAAAAAVWTYMAFDLLFAGASLYDHVARPVLPDPEALGITGLLGTGMFLSFLVSVILVGCWIYRASANAHRLSDEMTISPGWAVGWYFVPIMNLVRPFQAMREAWMASHFRGNWHGEPTPAILGWWWGLWIITNILGNVSFQLSMNGDPGMADLIVLVDLAAAALNVPLCIILVALMRRIARAQATAIHDETFA